MHTSKCNYVWWPTTGDVCTPNVPLVGLQALADEDLDAIISKAPFLLLRDLLVWSWLLIYYCGMGGVLFKNGCMGRGTEVLMLVCFSAEATAQCV